MDDIALYQLFADVVLVLHASIVAFVVGGLVLVVAGNLRGWRWVNTRWFRATHLATIAFVAAEAWLGIACPLTAFEAWLRGRAQEPTYAGSCIEHWLQRWLFYDLPGWMFTVAYTLFGLAVIAAWWRYPPARAGAICARPRRARGSPSA